MKLKRNNIIFISVVVILAIIGITQGQKNTEPEQEKEAKQNFFITTEPLVKKDFKGIITKSATVQAASDITISAQVAGRVSTTHIKLGQEVGNKQLLISLNDIGGTYAYGAQRAALSVQTAENTYTINEQNLDKQLQDAQIAYQKTLLSSNNSILGNTDSTANLQVQQLEANLDKARLDYDIKLKADEQTLQNYINTAKNIYSDTNNLLLDVIDQTDKFLGYTTQNQHINNGFEAYIAVKDDKAKADAELKLAQLIAKKEQLKSLGNDITIDNATTYLSGFKAIVSDISEMTLLMKSVLNATTPGGTLTQAGLDGYVASFSALQTKASGISSSITSQVNGIDTFVTTYKDNQTSLVKQIESMETQIAVSKRQIEEASENASYNLLQSRNNVDFISSTKDENLESLRNSLGLAQVSYEEAQFNLGKFAISSPIPGIIREVLVDDGQEVTPGTPLVKMVGKGKEIVLKVTADEKEYITLGQTVEVEYRGVRVSGIVSEMGTVADKTANYQIKITIDPVANVDIGMFADVHIPLQKGNTIVPINAVNIVDNNRGQIYLWNGTSLEVKTVVLGNIYGNGIEVIDELPQEMELVVSDLSNYDPESMTLKKK